MHLPKSPQNIYDIRLFEGNRLSAIFVANDTKFVEGCLARSGKIKSSLDADEAFKLVCAGILAEGHLLDQPDFAARTVLLYTKITMLMGAGEEIALSIVPESQSGCVINYEGRPTRFFKSWAHRTVGKVTRRFMDSNDRKMLEMKHLPTVRGWKEVQEQAAEEGGG